MEQVGVVNTGIFAVKGRIGRLQYLAYCGAILMLLSAGLLLVGGWFKAFHGYETARAWIRVLVFAALLIYVVVTRRRLHDLDRHGAWALLAAVFSIWLVITVVNMSGWPLLAYARAKILVLLCNAAWFMALVSVPGTVDINRHGPPPSPNSGWVKIGAGVSIAAAAMALIWMVVSYGYYVHRKRLEVAEDVALLTQGEAPIGAYYRAHKSWPPTRKDLMDIFPALYLRAPGAFRDYIYFWASKENPAFRMGTSSAEVWTTDGGNTWHCGLAAWQKDERTYLPDSCRDAPPNFDATSFYPALPM